LAKEGGEGGREDPPVTAASSVADELLALIMGQLAPGASLPSEADLAERYDVSRLTVREAVKMLAGRGLLELARGRRAVVREPDGSAFGDFLASIIQYDPKGLFDLMEVRVALEIQSVTLAAKRASRAGLAAIENTIEAMQAAAADLKAGHDPEAAEHRYHHADVGFHEALALASGNRILTYLFEAMASPLQESFYLTRRGHQLRGHTPEHTIAAHRAILKFVREGNARGASEAMRTHLEDAERDIRAALGSRTMGPKG
jgi:GntR family transcriptional regulator, transcriptional repressor for pyruvate dehydrogenase complex